MIPQTKEQLAGFIDHTLLSPTAVRGDIERHCAEAVEYGFYSVCVQPRWISLAADILRDSKVKIDGVAGFPFGADSAKIKALQAEEVIMAGADEVDMVADLASIIEGSTRYLFNDIKSVSKVCRSMRPAVVLKVIIEASALTSEQVVFACKVAEDAGADFVKTSTGYHSTGGARVEDVKLMVQSAPNCKVKAAGGIRTSTQALDMIAAGASRIGTSASIDIIKQFDSEAC